MTWSKGRRLAAGILLVTVAMAEARAEPTELTLEQAMAMARKSNRSLLVERAHWAQAKISVDLAWAALFPTVAAQSKYTRNNVAFGFQIDQTHRVTVQPKNQLDASVGFTMPLLAPSAYWVLQAAKSDARVAEAQFETSRSTILLGVAQAFYAAAIADEVMQARQSSIDVARATQQTAETRYRSGSVTKVDVDRAELALVRAEQSAIEAGFAREQAYRALATLTQASAGFRVKAFPETAPRDEASDLDSALRLRPEFRVLELSLVSVQAQRKAQAWRWSPTLSAFGSLRVFNYDNFAREQHAWALGLQLDWLLYDGGSRDAQRHLAAARADEAIAQAAVLRDVIGDDLANNRGLLDTKRHAEQAAQRSVALALETLELVRTQYAAGIAAQLDLLQAQDGLVAAKEALAQAHFEVAVADLSLRHAAGTFPGP